MRIAVIHNLAYGGAHRRLRSQIAAFSGHVILEVTLSTGKPVTDTAVVIPLRQRAADHNRLLRPPLRYLDLASLLHAWARAAEIVNSWGADVCFVNPCQFLQTPALVTRLTQPVVYYCDEPRRDFHDRSLGDTFNPTTKAIYYPLRRAQRACELHNSIAADRIATNSDYTVAMIRDALGVGSVLVPCGVAECFSAGAGLAPVHVLAVGSLIPSKGHDLAIEAVAASAVRLPLVIVSPQPGSLEEQTRLSRLAERCGVELTLRVGLTETELRAMYRGAFATLYLARSEPFGLASVEAQACGSPVIVADEGGLPETVDPGVSGWCVPRDATQAGAALNRLLDPVVRQSMVERAPRWASRFTWKNSVSCLDAVFDDLIEAGPEVMA